MTIAFSDIQESLKAKNLLNCKFDAWFLDGFSPDRNEAMWSQDILKELKNNSHNKTTFSSFSSASSFKKNVTRSGASLQIKKGFSTKKHMTIGSFNNLKQKKRNSKKVIAIIGGGIAGATLAYSLFLRGHKSVIFEKNHELCSGASGCPALISYPKISAYNSPYSKFAIHSFIYSTKFYENFSSSEWNKTGVLLLETDERSKKRIHELLKAKKNNSLFHKVTAAEASVLSNTKLVHSGLFFPTAGWLEPHKICQALTKKSKTIIKLNEHVLEINNTNGKLSVLTNLSKYQFDDICLCNSFEASNLSYTDGIRKKRGQLSLIHSNKDLSKLLTPLCANGYISPLIHGYNILGATYSDNLDINSSTTDTIENLKILESLFPNSQPEYKLKTEKVGFRATTPDHLPIAGKNNDFYFNIGHGSRGSTSAPFCSEYIADLINGSPHPMDNEMVKAISWDRFNLKN